MYYEYLPVPCLNHSKSMITFSTVISDPCTPAIFMILPHQVSICSLGGGRLGPMHQYATEGLVHGWGSRCLTHVGRSMASRWGEGQWPNSLEGLDMVICVRDIYISIVCIYIYIHTYYEKIYYIYIHIWVFSSTRIFTSQHSAKPSELPRKAYSFLQPKLCSSPSVYG